MKTIALFTLLVVAQLGFAQKAALTWHTDINEASAIAKKENKPMMLFFTGSDWCGWCVRLQNEVFRTPEFEAWAKANVILVELDFPRSKPQSEANDPLIRASFVFGFTENKAPAATDPS